MTKRDDIPDLYQDLIILTKYDDAIKLLSDSVSLFAPDLSIDKLISLNVKLLNISIEVLKFNHVLGIWNLPDLNKELTVKGVDQDGLVESTIAPVIDSDGYSRRRRVDTTLFQTLFELFVEIQLTLKNNATQEPSVTIPKIKQLIDLRMPSIKFLERPKSLEKSTLVPDTFDETTWDNSMIHRSSRKLKVLKDSSPNTPKSSGSKR